jgi:hypothetical protein
MVSNSGYRLQFVTVFENAVFSSHGWQELNIFGSKQNNFTTFDFGHLNNLIFLELFQIENLPGDI